MEIPANNIGKVRTELESVRDNVLVRQRGIIQLEHLLNATYEMHRLRKRERLNSIKEVLSYNASFLPQDTTVSELEQKSREGNDLAKEWKEYYENFETLFNKTHKDIDIELSNFRIKYNKSFIFGSISKKASKVIILTIIFIVYESFLIKLLSNIPHFRTQKQGKIILLLITSLVSLFLIYKNMKYFWNSIKMDKNYRVNHFNLKKMKLWKEAEKLYVNEIINLLFVLLCTCILGDLFQLMKGDKLKSSIEKIKRNGFLITFENNNCTIVGFCLIKMFILKYFFTKDEKVERDIYDSEIVWIMMKKLLKVLFISDIIFPLIIRFLVTVILWRRKKEGFVNEKEIKENFENENEGKNVKRIVDINVSEDNIKVSEEKVNKQLNNNSNTNEMFNYKTVIMNILKHGLVFLIYSLFYSLLL